MVELPGAEADRPPSVPAGATPSLHAAPPADPDGASPVALADAPHDAPTHAGPAHSAPRPARPTRPDDPVRVLDLGAGTGALGLAVADHLLSTGRPVHLTAIELEPAAFAALASVCDAAVTRHRGRLTVDLRRGDLFDLSHALHGFDLVVTNPPWFKLSPSDPRGGDAPNAYARFLEAGAAALRPGGQLLAIVPRSFTSGAYFARFRRRFGAAVRLDRALVLGSRRDAFRADGVLQETLIGAWTAAGDPAAAVLLAHAPTVADLAAPVWRPVPRALVTPPGDDAVRLPVDDADLRAITTISAWPANLSRLGLRVSTGPIVPFRTAALRDAPGPSTVPLLWLQHVHPDGVRWPLDLDKPEHIEVAEAGRALSPSATMVLVRRFSPKEALRRVVAAPLAARAFGTPQLGVENHLNLITAASGDLDLTLAWGLCAVLQCDAVDRWLRALVGNTQVGAAELRALPLPHRDALTRIGAALREQGARALGDAGRIEAAVAEGLG